MSAEYAAKAKEVRVALISKKTQGEWDEIIAAFGRQCAAEAYEDAGKLRKNASSAKVLRAYCRAMAAKLGRRP